MIIRHVIPLITIAVQSDIPLSRWSSIMMTKSLTSGRRNRALPSMSGSIVRRLSSDCIIASYVGLDVEEVVESIDGITDVVVDVDEVVAIELLVATKILVN